jgi:hypothetical protein
MNPARGATLRQSPAERLRPANGLVADIWRPAQGCACCAIHRGGPGTTLNELAEQSQVSIEIEERSCAVHPAVRGAARTPGPGSALRGKRGQDVAVAPAEADDDVLRPCVPIPWGRAAHIGSVAADHPGGDVAHPAGHAPHVAHPGRRAIAAYLLAGCRDGSFTIMEPMLPRLGSRPASDSATRRVSPRRGRQRRFRLCNGSATVRPAPHRSAESRE